jgi:hypothetical protein
MLNAFQLISCFHYDSVSNNQFQGIWFERWQTFEDRNCSFLDFINCDNSGDGFRDLLDHTVIARCFYLKTYYNSNILYSELFIL